MPLQSNAYTTLAALKTYLKITFSTDDSLLEDLINEASDIIDSKTDRTFAAATVTEYINGVTTGRIMPRRYPINSITSIAYASGDLDDPTWNLLAPETDYILDQYNGIINVGGMFIGAKNYRIIYNGGYATLPDDIVRACKIIAAAEYNRSSSDGAKSESIVGTGMSWEEDIPVRAKRILDKYKRLTF
jgi:hypothetical protein